MAGARAEAPVGRPRRTVLAERNQRVAPVGAWVERAGAEVEQPQGLAFVSAFQVEEELKEQQKEKEESLRRFQEEVKQRVNQQARRRRKHQLQKSYEAAEKESCVLMQCSDSALHLTPKKNTCVYRSNAKSAICSLGTNLVPRQQLGDNLEEQGENQSKLFQQQVTVLGKTMKQVRRRLASCKTVPEGAAPFELSAGIWRIGLTREKLESRSIKPLHREEVDNEEFPLAGHHDLPAELRDEMATKTQTKQGDELYFKSESGKVYNSLMKESCLPGPSLAFRTDYHAPLVLWPGIDGEETKKQRQNQYLRYRRLFMDIEREQVKEQQRLKEQQKKIAKIKREKEHQRHVEEKRIQEMAFWQDSCPSERACEILAQLKLEEQSVKNKKKHQQNKEYVRYIEALRAQMREKMKLYNIDLPPLCCCGSDFWDCHPDTCANNCMFYKNHKAYSQALQSVISSCDTLDGNSTTRLAINSFAALHARSLKSA
ncbi:coiled-coil domain-containing protein 15 [Alligator mississippiensis]|uniref:Coiled-coil domain-containing protein 15 n=2 Tax=Alligator mississippiensis TaxID=8496 RepID=A0A151NH20_ALLMI|nr:coiled-coil domain-containing protein 15 [Alligator mississippiensis]